VVGLGNPGAEFARTRHNLGAETVALLAARHGERLRAEKGTRSDVAQTRLASRLVALAVPQTFMNESGLAVAALARRFGVSDIFDPADNIQGGARYLKYLLELYKGDEALALAAYNAGEGAVSRYGGVPPFPETQDYVAKVRQRLAATPTPNETGVAPSAVQSNGAAETVPAEAYNPIREVVDANGKVYYISH